MVMHEDKKISLYVKFTNSCQKIRTIEPSTSNCLDTTHNLQQITVFNDLFFFSDEFQKSSNSW